MKRMVASVIMGLAMVGAMATSALAISYDGPSVSISSAEFSFGVAGTNLFTTSGASSPVTVNIFNQSGVSVFLDNNASLVVTPVDFSGGFLVGTGGGFTITDTANAALLSGTFGTSSLTTIAPPTNAEFEASTILTFVNPALMQVLLAGTSPFGAPGLFSATLGDVTGGLVLGQSWTTQPNATAQIQSSSVPEPTSLLLLGAGLAGLGIWRRKSVQA